MVSIEQTSKKYFGKKAATYEEVRTKQRRWTLENQWVEQLMEDAVVGTSLLDVPCGTGRFFPLWHLRGLQVTGVDISSEMLEQARDALKKAPALYRAARDLSWLTTVEADVRAYCKAQPDRSFDSTVCVRFLDLIDEAAMRTVLTEFCRITRERIIITIRFGDKYVPKSNTAEHDRAKFFRFVKRFGWQAVQEIPVFTLGWSVLLLKRKE